MSSFASNIDVLSLEYIFKLLNFKLLELPVPSIINAPSDVLFPVITNCPSVEFEIEV